MVTPKKDFGNILLTEVGNQDLITNFISLQNQTLKSNNDVVFDNSVIYEVKLDENSQAMLVANQIGFHPKNQENFGFAVAFSDGKIFNPMIIKTSRLPEGLYQIDYYKDDFTIFYSVLLNADGEPIKKTIHQRYSQLKCGQDTADCINDAYTNHGWISVWAWVQSAFLPPTVAAIAAACATGNCLQERAN